MFKTLRFLSFIFYSLDMPINRHSYKNISLIWPLFSAK